MNGRPGKGVPNSRTSSRCRDGAPFAMAGIWDDWLSADGSELESCAVVTTAANDHLAPIHHRMPVILDPKDWDAWLDNEGTSATRGDGTFEVRTGRSHGSRAREFAGQ